MSMPASIRLPRQLRCHVHQPPLVFSGQGSFDLFFLVPTSTLLFFILTHALRILCAFFAHQRLPWRHSAIMINSNVPI